MFEEEIEQNNMTIADKCRLQAKLEDELEQYHIKIHRADQLVCRKTLHLFLLFIFNNRSNVLNKSFESKILNTTNLI